MQAFRTLRSDNPRCTICCTGHGHSAIAEEAADARADQRAGDTASRAQQKSKGKKSSSLRRLPSLSPLAHDCDSPCVLTSLGLSPRPQVGHADPDPLRQLRLPLAATAQRSEVNSDFELRDGPEARYLPPPYGDGRTVAPGSTIRNRAGPRRGCARKAGVGSEQRMHAQRATRDWHGRFEVCCKHGVNGADAASGALIGHGTGCVT